MTHHSPLLVVTGVSGSGKTTVGAALARRLHVPFADADDFHPPHNIAKMSAGLPLTDHDRAPWLRSIGAWLATRGASGGVISCSALRREYRDVLLAAAPGTRFAHLAGDIDEVRRRVAARPGHFMPPSLVDSQFAALEPLDAAEPGITLDLRRSVDQLVDDVLAYLATTQGAPAS